jgi:hypothetical protein
MPGFQLPKSHYVPQQNLSPEAAKISLILRAALEQTPEIAPILTLAATLALVSPSSSSWATRH